jgi:pimeloyl-ACP methyl ester carboxylesterase
VVRIAYATLGQGPALVKTANWMSHLQYDWKSPLWRHLARELSRDFRLVRYDQRGNGLSDLTVEDFSLDACVGDLEAVIDAVGLERFALLGVSQGSRVAVAYAVRHPERVSRLVLYGGAARGFKHRSQGARETRAGLQGLIREGWGATPRPSGRSSRRCSCRARAPSRRPGSTSSNECPARPKMRSG